MNKVNIDGIVDDLAELFEQLKKEVREKYPPMEASSAHGLILKGAWPHIVDEYFEFRHKIRTPKT